jgi:hypothetical protein
MFGHVKELNSKFFVTFLIAILFFSACKKDNVITSADAVISFSADTLHFDTVFTSVGSVTQKLKIFNLNNQRLRISTISLAGGETSAFKINVNGMPGSTFSDIDIAANDSIYVFVSVTINPTQSNLPFIIRDSIMINYNDNADNIQLDAYGRNARFVNNLIVTKDSTFTNELPFVILGSLTVNEGATLVINSGTEIYYHQNAAVFINGTLKANGEKEPGSQIVFSSDRLDDPYKFFPGSWQGILFSSTSTNNRLNSTIIQNAVQGINISGEGNTVTQLELNSCAITNNQNEGIKAVNSNIYAENCLITNCGLNNLSLNAGNYNFIFCTVASYSDILLSHSAPVLFISDTINSTQTAALAAKFTNSIFYGESGSFDDEILLSKTGNDFNTSFSYVLYKAINVDTPLFKNCISNTDPLFANIDQEHAEFDFHLMPGSPCVNAGSATSITTDIEGNPRTSGSFPDMGCYESQ